MNEVALFNPLQLSDDQFDTIAGLSSLNYSNVQIALYLELEITVFEKALKSKNSKIKHHIIRGKLEADFNINEKLLATAKTGNITAIQQFDKAVERNYVNEIKRKILFYED